MGKIGFWVYTMLYHSKFLARGSNDTKKFFSPELADFCGGGVFWGGKRILGGFLGYNRVKFLARGRMIPKFCFSQLS